MNTCDGCGKRRRDVHCDRDGMGFCFLCRKEAERSAKRHEYLEPGAEELKTSIQGAVADEESNDSFWSPEIYR